MEMEGTAPKQRPNGLVRVFRSREEQEAETEHYWSTQSIKQKLDASAEMAKHAYSLRPLGSVSLPELPQELDQHGRCIHPSRVLRRFSSFAEQDAWNRKFVRP